jgi:arginine decarboxylase-like protein
MEKQIEFSKKTAETVDYLESMGRNDLADHFRQLHFKMLSLEAKIENIRQAVELRMPLD